MALPTISTPFLLSERGSVRATAYQMTNKAVRIGTATCVTWLDAVSGIRTRSFDHDRQSWSETLALDEAIDNHANPSLTADPAGGLRIAYGAHGFWEDGMFNHGRFRLQQSRTPDGAHWDFLSNVGYGATYACLVTDSQGRDHLVYRGGEGAPGCFYERRLANGNWDLTTKLSLLPIPPGYTFVGANLVIAPGDILYAGFMYYSLHHQRSLGVCAVMSPDAGETWTGLRGEPVKLPLPYDSAYAIPHAGDDPYLGSLSVDHDGNLVALTTDIGNSHAGAWLSVFRAGAWVTTALNPFLPVGWEIYLGCVTVDARGRLLIVVDATPTNLTKDDRWGHPLTECFLLASDDGGRSFTAQQISATNPAAANWLPNISHVGPYHDLRTPLITYTQGPPGKGCQPQERTNVYTVWVE